MEWKKKAKWLQDRGFLIQIEALYPGNEYRWKASIGYNEYRMYGNTIQDVIEQIYDCIRKEYGG